MACTNIRTRHRDSVIVRIDRFIGPLSDQEDSSIAVIVRAACRFGCKVSITVVPREWRTWRVSSSGSVHSHLPSTEPSDRLFLTSGFCASCCQRKGPPIQWHLVDLYKLTHLLTTSPLRSRPRTYERAMFKIIGSPRRSPPWSASLPRSRASSPVLAPFGPGDPVSGDYNEKRAA